MILVRYTPKFIRMYSSLESALQDEVKEKISLFKNEKNHNYLKVHKLTGRLDSRYVFSINYKIRIVFNYEDKKTVNFLLVGNHDETYR